METKIIDHIGIAVNSIDEAMKFWEGALGVKCHGVEEVAEQKVKTAFLPIDDSEIELLEGTSEDSPVSKFIAKNGQGIQHIAIRVADIEAALAELKEKGVRLIDEKPPHRRGRRENRLPPPEGDRRRAPRALPARLIKRKGPAPQGAEA